VALSVGYSDALLRAAQYFFIRRLTAFRAAGDIFRRRPLLAPEDWRDRAFRAGRPRPAPPASALIAWVSFSTSRSSADRSERSCCTSLP
jgi:hypothetical protein